jgi:4,5-dihydroxyphthalate decarboxylase
MPTLTMPTRDYGLMLQMKEDVVELNDDIQLEYPEFDNILVAARRMVRELAFDICEMPVTTYLCARAHKKRFTAIPVFITRNFHHAAIFHDTKSGIRHPRDLEGRTVGVNRGYTVTTGVWARGVLQNEYGVNLDKVRWAATDDEHVAEFELPPNANYLFKGRKIGDLFETGDIDAAVGAFGAAPAGVEPLIPDAVEAGFAAYRKTGIYPVNHTIVVRDDLLEEYPGLAADLFDALTESKGAYYGALDRSGELSEEDALTVQLETGLAGDPFPYGIEPNSRALDALAQMAVDQHITPRRFEVEELFAEGTLDLIG